MFGLSSVSKRVETAISINTAESYHACFTIRWHTLRKQFVLEKKQSERPFIWITLLSSPDCYKCSNFLSLDRVMTLLECDSRMEAYSSSLYLYWLSFFFFIIFRNICGLYSSGTFVDALLAAFLKSIVFERLIFLVPDLDKAMLLELYFTILASLDGETDSSLYC